MKFEFATAGRILFGPGVLETAIAEVAEFGNSALVVTGSTPDRAAPLLARLAEHGVTAATFPVHGEPTLETVRQGRDAARDAQARFVIGFGGGSAIDAAKAIAALTANPGDPLDYLEVIGKGQPLTETPLPTVAIPTTAGTGAEVTRNSVLGSPEHRVKASLRHPLMLPRLAIVDPRLTFDLPPFVTASTGMDALTQLIEPFVSHRANPLTDAICREALPKAARNLRQACHDGRDQDARTAMAFASLSGGLALANAGLGAVHGFAAPIGGMFPAPHGAVCAALLPAVMDANLRALKARMPAHPAIARYQEIAALLTGDRGARPQDGVDWVRRLGHDLEIPTLSHWGVAQSGIPDLVEKAASASSMKANPLPLTPDELTAILERSL